MHDVNLAAYHLPLDAHPEVGNNALIADALGLTDRRSFAAHRGEHIGITGHLPGGGLTPEAFVEAVGAITQPPLAFLHGPEVVRTVGIVSGGAADDIVPAAALGLDAFITGEPAERSQGMAEELGIHFLAAGHHATERFGIRALGEVLAPSSASSTPSSTSRTPSEPGLSSAVPAGTAPTGDGRHGTLQRRRRRSRRHGLTPHGPPRGSPGMNPNARHRHHDDRGAAPTSRRALRRPVGDVGEARRHLGAAELRRAALRHHGRRPRPDRLGIAPGERICILGNTCRSWTVADFGATRAGAIVVPIYQTNSPEECDG